MTYTLQITAPGARNARRQSSTATSAVRATREAGAISQRPETAIGTRIEVLERRGWLSAARVVATVTRRL